MSAKTATKKPAKPAKVKVEKDTENGITRPKAGTTCAAVWDAADKISESTGEPAQRAAVIEAASKQKINEKTITTQFGRWRKYNGLKGRTPKPKVEKPKKVSKKKAAPAAAPAGATV